MFYFSTKVSKRTPLSVLTFWHSRTAGATAAEESHNLAATPVTPVFQTQLLDESMRGRKEQPESGGAL